MIRSPFPGRGPAVSAQTAAIGAAGALALLALAVGWAPPAEIGVLAALGVLAVLGHRWLLQWQTLLVGTILVIMFIPIRRYSVPSGLPFELEPYRIGVAFLVAAWVGALLVDPRVRLRRTGFEGPIVLIAMAVLVSVVVNPSRVAAVSDIVAKELSFLASFFLVVFMIASLGHGRRFVEAMVGALVGGGAIIAAFSIWEARTGYNIFNDLARVLPVEETQEVLDAEDFRGARAYGSAQHPIALGAALVMLIPLSLYKAISSPRRRGLWIAATLLMLLGSLSTVSRTSVLMLLTVVAVFLALRPAQTRRVLPLVLPALLIVQLVLPGRIGAIQKSFFPEGGLIAEQQKGAETRGSGRIADLAPSYEEFSRTPIFGQGFGTRVVDDTERQNAIILDNEWLGTALQLGIVGLIGWIWLFSVVIGRLGKAASADRSLKGWLMTALAASVSAYALGMFTFDSFAFIQVTFILFIMIALAAIVLRPPTSERAPDGARPLAAEAPPARL